jgi:phosphosulfolactate synthase
MIWRQEELSLPPRKRKPRASGLTVVIVNGAPIGYFEDVVASASDHIDMVKFGWGTALVTADLERKTACLRAHEVE